MSAALDAVRRLREAMERATPGPFVSEDSPGAYVLVTVAGVPREFCSISGQAAASDLRHTAPDVMRANGRLVSEALNALPALLDLAEAAAECVAGQSLERVGLVVPGEPWARVESALVRLAGGKP